MKNNYSLNGIGFALCMLFIFVYNGHHHDLYNKITSFISDEEEPKTEEVAVHPDFEPAVASEPEEEVAQDEYNEYPGHEITKPIPITFEELGKRLQRNSKQFSLIVSEFDELWFMGGSENRLEADIDEDTQQIKRLELIMPLVPENAETIVKANNTLIQSLEPKLTKEEYNEVLSRLEFVNVSEDGIIGGQLVTKSNIDWFTTTDDTVDPRVLRVIVVQAD